MLAGSKEIAIVFIHWRCYVAVCEAGYLSRGDQCIMCDYGEYQSESNFIGDSCTECPSVGNFKKTTLMKGSTDEDDCICK